MLGESRVRGYVTVMNTRSAVRQVTWPLSRIGLLVGACILAHTATPASADQTIAARQAPAAMVLEVPSNPDHALPSELNVLSFEYDAAAHRLTYTRGYDTSIDGSFLLERTDAPVPIVPQSSLRSLEVRESDGNGDVFRRVTFRDVHVVGIVRDGDGRRMSFTAASVTVR
jgi:hypothetical protein